MPGFDLASCLLRLAERNPGKTEADIQSDVRDVLLYGGFHLGNEHVRLESPAENRKRLDVEVGAVVIECKRDLRPGTVRREAETQLGGYLRGRQTSSGQPYAGVLTDGAAWTYHLMGAAGLREISAFQLHVGQDNEREFRRWLGAILATEHHLVPKARLIEERLGSDSPACRRLLAQLSELWGKAHEVPAGRLKRELWARLLRTALGTQFEDADELFVEHTYLVLLATLIAHAVIGFDLSSQSFSPAVALSGQLFADAGIEGVGEAGFFDWVLGVEGGDETVGDIERRVACFDWSSIDHDVLKALYQSVINPEVRHRLGEYYTPDWLATRIVNETVRDPLNQRILDPACGSGTFLFAAISLYLDAADAAGVDQGAAVDDLPAHVSGMDLHPVAVSLAQVT